MGKAWLARFSWEAVTAINAQLCAAKNALHKPRSDGHDEARTLWEAERLREMSWQDAKDGIEERRGSKRDGSPFS